MTQEELEQSLSELKLYVFQKNYSELAKSSLESDLGHVDYLSQLTALELEERYQKKIQRLLKKSKIPKNKDIQDFDVSRIPGLNQTLIKDFCRGEFIDRRENLLIFGNPGTGKTHLAISLAREWCYAGTEGSVSDGSRADSRALKSKIESAFE
jgi:DNA replication protein DnaC